MSLLTKGASGSLFIRPDEDLSSITPAYTQSQIKNMQVWSETYYIGFGAGGEGTRYNLSLPNGNTISVCRTNGDILYGAAGDLINEFIKGCATYMSATDKQSYDWLIANTASLNAARNYWAAVSLRETAERMWLRANLCACRAAAGGVLSMQDEKRLITEFGYDPENTLT